MKRIISLITLCSFCFTGCNTVRQQPYQIVNVSSKPSGATILVDGDVKGVTPLALSMNLRHSHAIVLEKEGYQSKYYRMKSGVSAEKLASNALIPFGCAAAGIATGALMFVGITGAADLASLGIVALVFGGYGLVAGAALGAVGVGVDLCSGKAKQLSPREIRAELQPAELAIPACQ